MLDDHKVNEVLMKEIMLTWLFKFGHDVILHSTIVKEKSMSNKITKSKFKY
jgi:hypothetical protein